MSKIYEASFNSISSTKGMVVVQSDMFGADMLRFTKTDPFQTQSDSIGVTHVRWPGGIIVDANPGIHDDKQNNWLIRDPVDGHLTGYVYDLKQPNIINPVVYQKEGLREAMAYAVENDLGFTMLIPQNRYIVVDPTSKDPSKIFTVDYAAAYADLNVFITRLLSGYYGEVPDDFNLQFGQEYYGGVLQDYILEYNLDQNLQVAAIGKLENAQAIYIANKVSQLTASGLNTEHVDPEITINMGRIFSPASLNKPTGSADDVAIFAAQFTAAGFKALDNLLVQRYINDFDTIANSLTREGTGYSVQTAVSIWEAAAEKVGVTKDFDVIAGWAKSSLTRGETQVLYTGTVTNEEVTNRTNKGFEQFYQKMVGEVHDYGAASGSFMLQYFASLVQAGVDAATYYGVDLNKAGMISGRNAAGGDEIFFSGTLFGQMAKHTVGMVIDDSYLKNSRANKDASGNTQLNQWIYEDATKVVAYFSVNDINNATGADGTVSFSNHFGLSAYFSKVEAYSMEAYLVPNWQSYFGVKNLDAIWGSGFQSGESSLYEMAKLDKNGNLPTLQIDLKQNDLNLHFSSDYQVIEVIFTKTPNANGIRKGTTGDDVMKGYALTDIMVGDAGNDKLYGYGGNDTINAGSGNDFADGGDGADYIMGKLGNDKLQGGAGDDRIFGGGGNDEIYGGSQNDRLHGGNGDDKLFGGDGNDLLYGDPGADLINGGDGYDIAIYSTSNGAITVNLADMSKNTGDARGDRFVSIEGVFGSKFNDVLIGDAGNNYLKGFYGNDRLEGGAGNDTLLGGYGLDNLNGGAGNDRLIGGAGADVLTGGTGKDAFVFEFRYGEGQTTSQNDRITDFEIGQDTIEIWLEGSKSNGVVSSVDLQANYVTFSFSGTNQKITFDGDWAGKVDALRNSFDIHAASHSYPAEHFDLF
jgi:Ca2+-binding RTX toxin-like protein